MAEDREGLVEHYRAMRADLLAAIEGLSEEQLTERSLDGWSVKEHLAHVAFWNEMRAAEVIRLSAGHEAAWRLTGEQDDALNEIVHQARSDLPLGQVLWELDATHERLFDAIASATPAGLDASRYGEAGLVSRHEAEHTGWIRRWREERGI